MYFIHKTKGLSDIKMLTVTRGGLFYIRAGWHHIVSNHVQLLFRHSALVSDVLSPKFVLLNYRGVQLYLNQTYRQEPHFDSTYRFRNTSHVNDRCDVLRWVTGGRFVLFVLLFVFVVLLSEPLSLCTPGSPRVSDLINWPHVMLFFGWSPMHYVENTLPEDGVESTISYKTETHVWVNCNHCHDNKGWDLW